MLHSEFANSTQMQIILAFVTYAKTFASTYLIANIIMVMFNMSATRRQKVIFTLITGSLLQNTFVYAVYLVGGMMEFNNVMYHLVVHPNPFTAMLYYFTARKVFRLPPVRSIKLMSYVYLFWISNSAINRFIGAAFFYQNGYTFLLDALLQMTTLLLFTVICATVQYLLKKNHANLKFTENLFFNKRRELFIYFLKACFVYAVTVFMPLKIADQAVAHFVVCLVLFLFIVVNVCMDVIKYDKQTISNHEVHISALFKGTEALRGIKHDFNNILHTYSGFLELKEYARLERYHAKLVSDTSHAGTIMELGQKMEENPAVIRLLINKLEYAERMNVQLILSIKCELDNLYIDDMDAIRIMACLLDNAIEAASDSAERKVHFTVESKRSGSKLIIITNSTSAPVHVNAIMQGGMTSKTGHSGIGLSIVRNIVEQYGNSTFQIKYFGYEFSAYIELKDIA